MKRVAYSLAACVMVAGVIWWGTGHGRDSATEDAENQLTAPTSQGVGERR